jgi:hypothetical protein
VGLRQTNFSSLLKGLPTVIHEGESWAKQNPNTFFKGIGFLFPKNAQKFTFGIFWKQKTRNSRFGFSFAEKEGFEPPDLLQSTVFKTAAIDHSAISPIKMCLLA